MARTTSQIQIEGRNMVHDALCSPQRIRKLFVSLAVRSEPKIKEIITLAAKKLVSVEYVSAAELEKLCESDNAQGVIAHMTPPESVGLEEILRKKREVFIVLLNRIDYEQNLGAILRSAWAAGVDAVVASPNGVHELTPVVAKVSMGAAAFIPLIGMSLFQALDLLERYAVRVIGVEVDQGEIYTKAKLKGSIAFLMGGESSGLSEPLSKKCDEFVNIPMTSGVASLNVSVASALVMFERIRQERES